MREYLPLLQERQKRMKLRRNFAVGDTVVILDPHAQRGPWLLGKIIQTGRSVQLKTTTGLLDKSVSKICLLLEDTKD